MISLFRLARISIALFLARCLYFSSVSALIFLQPRDPWLRAKKLFFALPYSFFLFAACQLLRLLRCLVGCRVCRRSRLQVFGGRSAFVVFGVLRPRVGVGP